MVKVKLLQPGVKVNFRDSDVTKSWNKLRKEKKTNPKPLFYQCLRSSG